MGCGVSPPLTVIHVPAGEKPPTVEGDTIKFRRGAQESYVGIHGGYFLVRGQEDWLGAWPTGQAPALPATFEPARSMLVLGVAEKKEIADIKIQKILETADFIHVYAKESRIGENCPTPERMPFDVVTAMRVDKKVKFYVEEVQGESCGAAPIAAVSCRIAGAKDWSTKVAARPGDKIECEMRDESRGKFAVIDTALSMGEVPSGSAAKLAYTKGPNRAAFTVDVFGSYIVKAEASDDMLRKGTATATIDALPPKTDDILVQLVWANFDAADDPETFPRTKLRVSEEGPRGRGCSADESLPTLCEVKTHSAYTHMRLLPGGPRKLGLEVGYVDERVEKGPAVCVQLFYQGAKSAETCDRAHRDAGAKWTVGLVDTASGKFVEPAAADADAGAPDGGTEASKPAVPAKPPATKK